MTEAHKALALLPEPESDWRVQHISNLVGSACGIHLTHNDSQWFFLPGVPSEMKQMVKDSVLSQIPIASFTMLQLGIIGLTESHILEQVPEEWRNKISIRAHRRGTLLKFRIPEHQLENFPADALQRRLAENCYSLTLREHRKHADLAWCVLQKLRASEHSLALAESCTAGSVTAWIASHSGASQVLQQGIVVYSNAAKTQYCGVSPELLKQHGAVSKAVALQLADGVRMAAQSTWGIGITGIAGPGGGSPGKPVGTVHISVRGPGITLHHRHRFSGGRAQVVDSACAAALMMLLRGHRQLESQSLQK